MLPSCLSLFLNLPAHTRTVTCKCPDVVLSLLLLATTVCLLLGRQTKTASAICSPTNICCSKSNIVVNHIFALYFCCMHLLVNKLFVFVCFQMLGVRLFSRHFHVIFVGGGTGVHLRWATRAGLRGLRASAGGQDITVS